MDIPSRSSSFSHLPINGDTNQSTSTEQKNSRPALTTTASPHGANPSGIAGTTFNHPAEASSTHETLHPFHLSENYDEKIITPKNFKEILNHTNKIYNCLINSENNAINFNDDHTKTIRNSDKVLHLKKLKKIKKVLLGNENKIDVQKTIEYKKIKGERENSILEKLLNESSYFNYMLTPINGAFRDTETGLYAELHQVQDSNIVVLCFPGTGAGKMDSKQWEINRDQALGKKGIPPAYTQALELAAELKAKVEKKGFKFHVAGHSLGGGIANYVGIKLDTNSVCFNAAPLGGATKEDLKNDITPQRLEKQIHIRQKGDPVSNEKTQKAISIAASKFTKTPVMKPENVGIIYQIRKAKPANVITRRAPFFRHLLNSFGRIFDHPNEFIIKTKIAGHNLAEKDSVLHADSSLSAEEITSADQFNFPVTYDSISFTTAAITTAVNTLPTVSTTNTTTTTTNVGTTATTFIPPSQPDSNS